jgi:integrase
MGLPVLIMLYCGLRRGEVMALRWEDIDLDRRILSVNKSVRFVVNQPEVKKPKTEAGKRQVPIPAFLLEIFQSQPRKGLVCPRSQSQEHMSDAAYCRAWESYLHYLNLQAGGRDASRTRPKVQMIDNITAHMLRHTYASTLYNAGVDVKSAQRFLGHASLEMTLGVYTHLTKFKEDASVNALNGYLDMVMKPNV